MILVLPYPISANRYWQSHVPKGWTRAIVHPSKEAKAYKEEVGWRARLAGYKEPSENPMALKIRLCPRLNKDGTASAVVLDLGNCLKIAEDALQGIVYTNDKQVKRLELEYGDPVENGALMVEICEFAPAVVQREIFEKEPVSRPRAKPALDRGDVQF